MGQESKSLNNKIMDKKRDIRQPNRNDKIKFQKMLQDIMEMKAIEIKIL